MSAFPARFFGAALLVALPASAAPANANTLARLLACNDIPRAEERLQCYDSASRAALGLGPAQTPAASATQAADEALAEREKNLRLREAAIAKREAALAKGGASVQPASAAAGLDDALAAKDAEIKALQERLAALPQQPRGSAEEEATLFGIPIPFTRQDPMNQMENLPNQSIERDEEGGIEAIQVAIREWSTGADGKLIFVFENGQVWRQMSGEGPYLNPDAKTPYQGRIARGAMGSFNLTINDSNKIMKVRRVDGRSKRK